MWKSRKKYIGENKWNTKEESIKFYRGKKHTSYK